jgi:hypothetical protein
MFGGLPDLYATHPAPLDRKHSRAAVSRAAVRKKLFDSRVKHPFVNTPVNGRKGRVRSAIKLVNLAVRVCELLTI